MEDLLRRGNTATDAINAGNDSLSGWEMADVTTLFSSQDNVTGFSFVNSPAYDRYLFAETVKKYGIISFLTIACVLNTLAFLTMRTPSLRRLTSSIYLRTLAVTDTFTLVFFAGNQSVVLEERLSDVVCGLSRTLQHLFMMASSWIIVCLTAERYISLNHPLRRKTWCNRRKAFISIVVIAAISLCLCAPFAWNMIEIREYGINKCIYRQEMQAVLSIYHQTICPAFIIIVPSSVIIALNGLIICTLVKHRKTRTTSGGAGADAVSGRSAELEARLSLTSQNVRSSRSRSSRNADKVTVMLLVVSLYLPACSSPRILDGVVFRHYINSNSVTEVTSESRAQEVASANLRFAIVQLFMFTNYFVNFFFYVVFGRTFRRAFVGMATELLKKTSNRVRRIRRGSYDTSAPSPRIATRSSRRDCAGGTAGLAALVDISGPERQHRAAGINGTGPLRLERMSCV